MVIGIKIYESRFLSLTMISKKPRRQKKNHCHKKIKQFDGKKQNLLDSICSTQWPFSLPHDRDTLHSYRATSKEDHHPSNWHLLLSTHSCKIHSTALNQTWAINSGCINPNGMPPQILSTSLPETRTIQHGRTLLGCNVIKNTCEIQIQETGTRKEEM